VDLAADYRWEIIAGTARFAVPGSPELRVSHRDGGTVSTEDGHYLITADTVATVISVRREATTRSNRT
jgi:hypothetical protein